MLDKMQIRAVFLFEFKMGCKAAEVTHNINHAFGPGSANETALAQEVLQRRREPWRWAAQWPATGSWQQPTERIINAEPLTTTPKVVQELNVNPSMSFGIWSKLERWKSSISGYLMNRPRKKKSLFWSVIFSYCMQQQTMWRKVDFIWQPVITSSVVGPRRNSKALSKAKLAPKKGHGHSFGGLLPIWYTPAFWILVKKNHYIWEARSANRWDAQKLQCLQPALANRMRPIHLHNNAWPYITKPTLQKLKELGYEVLPQRPYTYHQPITTFSSISTTVCMQITFTTSMRQKMLSESSSNPEGRIFMLQE